MSQDSFTCVAELYKVVDIADNKLRLCYELSCATPQIAMYDPDHSIYFRNKYSVAADESDRILQKETLKHAMIKQNDFMQIMENFGYKLHDAHITDARENYISEIYNVEVITPPSERPYDNVGFMLNFTDRFAILALEKGREFTSINTIYEMFDEVQKHAVPEARE